MSMSWPLSAREMAEKRRERRRLWGREGRLMEVEDARRGGGCTEVDEEERGFITWRLA